LGQPVDRILDITTAEFAGWIAFYKWEYEETKKQMNKRSR
jgi:hypothetical protein